MTHRPLRLAAGSLALGGLASLGVAAWPTWSQAAGDPPTEEANRQVVASAFERWAGGRGDFFETVLSPDVVWTIEGSGPSAGTFAGRARFVDQAVRPFTARLSAPVRPVSYRVWADGDHVIVNWVGEAVVRDGGRYRNTYAWILRLRGGKAVEVNAFLDLPAYDEVLRRVSPPPE